MDNTFVRDATHGEARTIVQMIRQMVADMASYGGHAPATDDTAWNTLMAGITEELKGNESKYVIAESTDADTVGVAGAQLIDLHGVFAPLKTLHISAVY